MRYKHPIYRLPKYYDHQQAMFEWCLDTFGSRSINWKLSNGKFQFRFKRDYAHFLLRWA